MADALFTTIPLDPGGRAHAFWRRPSARRPRPDAAPATIYVAVGFLAGFTERFAQDMFVRSGRGLEGVMGDSPSSGPSAGISPPPGAQPDAAPAHGTP